MTELGDLEAKLGHCFRKPELLEQALTHGSVRHEQQTGEHPDHSPGLGDNERMEFLGDAIVGMVVAELLYHRYPELDEGELTRLRSALVSRRHLGQVGATLELGDYLRLGRAEERNGGRKKAVLLANCMEALIAGVYLEGGLAAAAAFVERIVALPYVEALRDELRENRSIGDYKTALQELLQARRAGQPAYVVQSESGPDHRKRFLVEARVSCGTHENKAQGEGSTKKKAEQEAARDLYLQLTRAMNGLSETHRATANNEAPSPVAAEHPGAAVSSQESKQEVDAMPSPLSTEERSDRPGALRLKPQGGSSKKRRSVSVGAAPSSPVQSRSTTHRAGSSLGAASKPYQPDASLEQKNRR